MSRTDFSRRDFNRLTMAAFGGVVTGSLAGCEKKPETGGGAGTPTGDSATSTEPGAASDGTQAVSFLLEEPHVCRGLNTCKGKGKLKENSCAGQGQCASVSHACSTQNECKGQGGCGANPGENSCKGKGGCAVPLMDHAWETARKNFEAAMKAAEKEFGAAPPKA